MIILDCAGTILIEKTKSNIILGIGLAQEVFEFTPVVDGDLPTFPPVGDAV